MCKSATSPNYVSLLTEKGEAVAPPRYWNLVDSLSDLHLGRGRDLRGQQYQLHDLIHHV